MRKLVYAALPIGKGTILDPYAESGATLAAVEYFSCDSIGIEINDDFYEAGTIAIPQLAALYSHGLFAV